MPSLHYWSDISPGRLQPPSWCSGCHHGPEGASYYEFFEWTELYIPSLKRLQRIKAPDKSWGSREMICSFLFLSFWGLYILPTTNNLSLKILKRGSNTSFSSVLSSGTWQSNHVECHRCEVIARLTLPNEKSASNMTPPTWYFES